MELGGNAVDEKSVAVGIGVGYQEDPQWTKKINPIGSWGILKNHLSCTVFLIYKSPKCFLPSFESIGLLIEEKKRKMDFQDGGHGSHLGFLIGTILAIFDLKVTPMLPTIFVVN